MRPSVYLLNFAWHNLILLGFVLFSTGQGFSQGFGGFKPGINWQQINTPVVRVIFPKGLEFQANRVANNILYLSENNRTSIGPLSNKLDLILNNKGIISNGYVSLMPFKSEFFTTPLQDGFAIGSGPWLDILSVHEYRHALQYINMRRGFTKLAWWLTGDTGWGTLMNITTPTWFFEGDAVATETALSKQGRGRMPSFLQQYRSILLSDTKYSYMTARNGSYFDLVPNAYELGYLLCSFGREKYGNDLWTQVLYRNSWLKGIIYPFSNAVSVFTGLNTRLFYKKALDDYKKIWQSELDRTIITPFVPLAKLSGTVTDYRFPVIQKNGELLVYKESYKEIGAIYRISSDGKETRICTTGISQDPYFSTSENQIAWTEVNWDARYSSHNYSDIVVYQRNTGKKIYLTHHKRYFSPALSPDGNWIVVAAVDSANHCLLKILDSQSGNENFTLPNPGNLYYTYPKWDNDGRSIISSARTPNGNMLVIRQRLFPSEGPISMSEEYNQIIGEVFVMPESILFTSGFSGINNIFSLSRSDQSISQLTSSKFGAYYPAVSNDQKQLLYSDFDKKGYRLVVASMDSLLWKQVQPEKDSNSSITELNYFAAEGGNIFDKIPDQKLAVTSYRQLQHPVRVHSWMISPGIYSAGINLVSDNILSNLHLEGGFNYYYNEKTPGFSAAIEYGGHFPILSAGLSRYYRHPDILSFINKTDTAGPIDLNDQLSLGVRLPLNLTKGENFRIADLKLGYNYISVKSLEKGSGSVIGSLVVSSIEGSAKLSSIKKKAYQNITTPLGISVELKANQSVGSLHASQYQIIGDFASRGFTPNQSLIISTGWKREPAQNLHQFMDLFLYPRGYSIPVNDWMFTIQSAYHFPLIYPDFGMFGIVYFSRIRANLFADYGYASIPVRLNNSSNGIFVSCGSELIFDLKWLNIVEIPLGIRFSLLLAPDFAEPDRKVNLEFVVPILRL
jgi:hypothetical protein